MTLTILQVHDPNKDYKMVWNIDISHYHLKENPMYSTIGYLDSSQILFFL